MIDFNDPKLLEDIEKVNATMETRDIALSEFREKADIMKANPDFALLSAMTFGVTALHDLCPAKEYGKHYPNIVLSALKRDVIKHRDCELCIWLDAVDTEFIGEMGWKYGEVYRPSVLVGRLEKVIASQELSEKLSSQLKQKPQRTATIKI